MPGKHIVKTRWMDEPRLYDLKSVFSTFYSPHKDFILLMGDWNSERLKSFSKKSHSTQKLGLLTQRLGSAISAQLYDRTWPQGCWFSLLIMERRFEELDLPMLFKSSLPFKSRQRSKVFICTNSSVLFSFPSVPTMTRHFHHFFLYSFI